MSDEAPTLPDKYAYPYSAPQDEERRAFVLSILGSPEGDGKTLIYLCEEVCAWLRGGELPSRGNVKNIKEVK